ncbi:TIR domain-containing protein [Frankia canadensis]|nr:TIR domain-containing protein [Frankia canadensis]
MASGDSFVFVSYTAADEAWAKWVATILEEAGLTARIQVWDSTPGTNFIQWMNTQLAEARWTVALYSKAYFESQWCTAEWTASLARQTLLPIRLERVEPPATLQVITWVDLFNLDERLAKEKVLHAVGMQVMPRLATFPGKSTAQSWPPSEWVSREDFTEAIKLLGSGQRHARIGGIRLLTRIAESQPSEQIAVIEILSSFIVEHTRALKDERPDPPLIVIETDVQVALNALGNLPDRPSLSRANLQGARLFGADLSGLNFSYSDLSDVDFTRAHLNFTDLIDTELAGANLAESFGLENEQIGAALGDSGTRLPQQVERPESWPPYRPSFHLWEEFPDEFSGTSNYDLKP